MRFTLIALALFLFLPHAAHAAGCATVDGRPLTDRLKEAEVAFIGTVIAVDGDRATFRVDHDLKNPARQPYDYGTEHKDDQCDHKFNLSETWIYGGQGITDPTFQLTQAQPLQRLDDAELAIAEGWQSCTADNECELFQYGCTATGLRADHIEQGKAKYWTGINDPRAANCAPSRAIYGVSLCVDRKCGWHIIPPPPQ